MGDGPVREIHVGCQVRALEMQFHVRDTGVGIDEEDLKKLFCVFRRGKNSAACHVPGKGVGLASVKSIIETYGGTIWADSTVGQGTSFKFTISGQYVPSAMKGPPDLDKTWRLDQVSQDETETAEETS
jgi:signal transduction histidine kinase